ncbi:hypothetical protein UT300003_33110 [Clostridium sardiniense]
MDKLKRKENESLLDYYKRIVFGKLRDKTIDNDYVEIAPYLFGAELSSCECRKRMYGVIKFLEQLESEGIKNIDNQELLNEIEAQKIELKKERMKNQTVNLELNKNVRRIARNEMTQEKILDAIANLEPYSFPTLFKNNFGEKECILPISDAHFGKECVIKGLKGEIINEYNETIFKERMDKLLSETINILNKEDINKVTVLLTGDLIDGILRMSQLQKLQFGIIDSTMRFAEYMSAWLNELSHYSIVDLRYCIGNHSEIRPLGSKNGDFAEENMEKIIFWFIKSRLENNLNITIFETEGDFIFFQSAGLNIMATHGQERNLEQAIKDYQLLYGESIDLFIAGHLHTKESKTIGISHKGLSDVEFVRVKSICSIDDFSTKLRRSAGAGTSLFVMETGKGKTITYDINLQ